jgi:hypothetical protein
MRECWDEAGPEGGVVVRGHWPAIKPPLGYALAEGLLDPDEVLPAMQDAFQSGDALVAMADHSDAAVRRSALRAALAADHPIVLADLAELERDADEQVAAAAAAARERLRDSPPPLRFEVLGGFTVKRGGWELDDAAWQRPMASRIVRFLLIQDTGGVPEDALFDAFWSDRPADSARQHLAVAVSRARKVLDLPGAEHSVIDVRERTYRLRLRDRDGLVALAANPYAAMPSLHAADALIVGVTLAFVVRRPIAKLFWAIWPAWVWFCVMATANHYWLDVVAGVAVALIAAGLIQWHASSRRPEAHRA